MSINKSNEKSPVALVKTTNDFCFYFNPSAFADTFFSRRRLFFTLTCHFEGRSGFSACVRVLCSLCVGLSIPILYSDSSFYG